MGNDKELRITNIDPDIHKDFKAACAFYQLDMRKALMKHMEVVVKDWKEALKSGEGPYKKVIRKRQQLYARR